MGYSRKLMWISVDGNVIKSKFSEKQKRWTVEKNARLVSKSMRLSRLEN